MIRRLPHAKHALAGLLLPVLASTAVGATPAVDPGPTSTGDPASVASLQLLPDQIGDGVYDPPFELDGPVDGTQQQHVSALLWSAYADAVAGAPSSCHLPISLLAAIGQVDSGSLSGRTLDTGHRVVPAVLGPVLDGNGFGAIADTDGGALDGNNRWDRAVGPMQILPDAWARWGRDGDDDGRVDPQDIEDATATTAAYLCTGGRDLDDPGDLASAILSHNSSRAYLTLVLQWKSDLESAAPETVELQALWLSTPVATLKATARPVTSPAPKPAPAPAPGPEPAPAPPPAPSNGPEPPSSNAPPPVPDPAPDPAPEPMPEPVPEPAQPDPPRAEEPPTGDCSETEQQPGGEPDDGTPAPDPEPAQVCAPSDDQEAPDDHPSEPAGASEPSGSLEKSGNSR